VAILGVEKFQYLGFIIQEKGDIKNDINQYIKGGWQKWKNSLEVLCDKKIPLRLKGKVYRMIVKSALSYDLEKKTQLQRLMVAEMTMICWMCDFTKLDGLGMKWLKRK